MGAESSELDGSNFAKVGGSSGTFPCGGLPRGTGKKPVFCRGKTGRAEKTGVFRQVRVCQHCRGCEGCGSVGNHRLPSIAHSTKPTPLTTLNEDDIETTLCMATCLLTVRAANFLSLMSRKHAWNRCLMEWKWLHCNHSPRPPNREPGSMRKKEKKSRGHEDDGTPTLSLRLPRGTK